MVTLNDEQLTLAMKNGFSTPARYFFFTSCGAALVALVTVLGPLISRATTRPAPAPIPSPAKGVGKLDNFTPAVPVVETNIVATNVTDCVIATITTNQYAGSAYLPPIAIPATNCVGDVVTVPLPLPVTSDAMQEIVTTYTNCPSSTSFPAAS